MTASKDCLLDSGKTAAVSGGIGLVVSAMQNTIQKHHTGARGVITRTGGTIAFFAAMGGIFTIGECVAKDIRKEDDAINAAIGGCAAGFLAGVRTHSFGKMALGCAAIGGTMYTYEASGQLKGQFANKTREEKKEHSKSFFKQNNLTEEA
ncbi:hypothetical protein G6F46_001544 [Rhizopus delemar]|uniref:Uncharacterized protein n=3 Tax=Rhizopus TaxID=4842 RepID=I1C381_RHIO9|nr:hypothetical protein RO3G_07616 [Rhizopus delemar RA 99-880]KAG1465177.1 hypothetical protein G6F55_001306 [Rhizopus delemar]KAG1551773.1 hypothetical protein G6F51_001636 [Rhizopus arrhizus]KAG1500339.1 hypothetical protein G6F54_003785 [Rhizopus delemar]KAG1517105.1 hypothetical protein G6F53_001634 [Rhizopus delemar]|eukprot:EIE82911.1 hypothetical protein RO3G_07616 [Rhizopus delemar RA 99-880]